MGDFFTFIAFIFLSGVFTIILILLYEFGDFKHNREITKEVERMKSYSKWGLLEPTKDGGLKFLPNQHYNG